MAIAPNLTFRYEFAVQNHEFSQSTGPVSPQDIASGVASQNVRWSGQGSGGASFGKGEGMVGPKPQFELGAGWLTVFPSGQWTQSLPLHWFSDTGYSEILNEALKASHRGAEALKCAP